MMRGAFLFGLVLVACDDDAADPNPNENPTGTLECANRVDTTTPEADATDVYYRTAIRVTLGGTDEAASLLLADADGTEVQGVSTVQGTTVVFEPAEPLATQTTYTATLTYECGTESFSFTTSSTGEEVELSPVDRVFALDLTEGDWTEPAGVGGIIPQLITEDVTLLFMPNEIVEGPDGDTISFIGSVIDPAVENTQDLCEQPFLVENADYTDPFFTGKTDALAINIAGFAVTIVNLTIAGDFAVDGTSIEIDEFSGEIDTRELSGLPIGDLCDLVGSVGAQCGPCSLEMTSKTCLDLKVENLVLPYLPEAPPLVPDPVCPE